ncbi:cupin domain containing protein [Pseudohyphozyma bogoriensis]|nr:cupin domain containing protein [Pseudohyphozyma bogoriensis]
MASPLPHPHRVVTGFNNETGKSIVSFSGPIEMAEGPGGGTKAGTIWIAPDGVADVQTKVDGATLGLGEGYGIVHPTGSVFRYLDMAPGAPFPLHFTQSLDYAVVLAGEVTLELDDGSLTVLKPGDSVVQNGSVHTWHNNGTEWFRMVFVMLPAKPVEINGKPLEGLRLQ